MELPRSLSVLRCRWTDVRQRRVTGFTSPSRLRIAKLLDDFTLTPSQTAERTKGCRAYARTTTPITTGHSCETPMETRLRRSRLQPGKVLVCSLAATDQPGI